MFGIRSRDVVRVGVAVSFATIALCFAVLPVLALGCYENLYVSGAGSAVVNGCYPFENMFFGKAAYSINMVYAVYWFEPESRWIVIDDNDVVYYANNQKTDTPPRSGWYVVDGSLPAPSMSGGEPCGEPSQPPPIEITGAGGGDGSLLDLPLPVGEGEDPPMVGSLPLCGVFEVGEAITGGCIIYGSGGNPVRSSYIHIYLYSVDITTVPETIVLLDHWTVHYNYTTGEYSFEVDTTALDPGYYDVRLTFADGSSQVLRVQVT
jgi:hypothetical protein